jgi:hypothetical protein
MDIMYAYMNPKGIENNYNAFFGEKSDNYDT